MITDIAGAVVSDAKAAVQDFVFVADVRDGFYHLILVEAWKLERREPFQPVYILSFATLEELEAGAEWVSAHRDRWQHWGALGQRSPQELRSELDALMQTKPMRPIRYAWMVNVEDDGRAVVLVELLIRADRTELRREAWRRDYASPEAAKRVAVWLIHRCQKSPDFAALVMRIDDETFTSQVLASYGARSEAHIYCGVGGELRFSRRRNPVNGVWP